MWFKDIRSTLLFTIKVFDRVGRGVISRGVFHRESTAYLSHYESSHAADRQSKLGLSD
jgi:hypothetical protein